MTAPPAVRRSALISLADACLVGCRFCFRADRGSARMDVATFARSLSRLHELGVADVVLTGGEPTDHPGLTDFVRLAAQFGLPCGIVTAARRGGRMVRLLRSASLLSWITVSADSRAAMELGRTSRSVVSAVEVIEQLPAACTSLHVVVWQLDADEVRVLRDLVAATGVRLEISPLLPTPKFHPPGVESAGDLVRQWRADLDKLADLIDVTSLVTGIERFVSVLSESDGTPHGCESQRLYLSASGHLRRCLYDRERQVSVWSSRAEIAEMVDEVFRRPSTVTLACAGVCH